jgi:hypothetical protein
MQAYNVPAHHNLLKRDIELHPGDVRTNHSSEALANPSGVRVTLRTVEAGGLLARTNDVPSGALSAHEILQAVAQSEDMKSRFPDLV